jgi:superfamily II DNA/RNA helicase
MEDKSLYDNLLNENYTDVRKNELIQRVFENKTKSLLNETSSTFKFAQGGGVSDEQKTYTPYEFLHELLPKVYGRPYVVSDEVGKQYNLKNDKEEADIEEFVNSKLQEYNVLSIYKIDDKSVIEEIEVRRRKLISDKSFITESELEAYLFCHPELHIEHYVNKTPVFDVNEMRSNGLIMVEYDKSNDSFNYVYVYEYLSGNVYEKLSKLREKKDRLIQIGVLNEEQFLMQEKALIKSFPRQGKITKNLETCLFILPDSKFGNEFKIQPNEVMDMPMSYSSSFKSVFEDWTKSEMDKALLVETNDIYKVHKYFTNLEKQGKYESDAEYSDWREKAFNDGKVALVEFLTKGLTSNCQLRLEYMWNERYNFYAEPKKYKIPVACHLSNKFKNKKDFVPNETQVQSLQFMKGIGSGLLAYGVGVGKTASAIMNISYSLDNNICKKPLLVVPNATYRKWEMEMFGGTKDVYVVEYSENNTLTISTFETERIAKSFAKSVNGTLKVKSEKIYGHISHVKNYVGLYNLDEESLRRVKDYSDSDMLKIENVNDLIKFLKDVPDNYNFDDDTINQKIEENYELYNYNSLLNYFNIKVESDFSVWWDKDINREKVYAETGIYGFDNGLDFYKSRVIKYTIKTTLEDEIKLYRSEMPFLLGSLKSFEDGTVFMVTYEGMKRLGLTMKEPNDRYMKSDDNSLYGQVYNELSQGDDISNANYKTKTGLAVLYKNSIFGKTRKKIDIREIGFDYVVFDESHYMKKAIVDCKGLPKYQLRGSSGLYQRHGRKYSFGENEKVSDIAIMGYFLTRYIQHNNNQSNVIHLTATPFTNKPAEIFSMLSLTNKEMLNKSGLIYMEQFFDLFMDISFELAFTPQGVERIESLLGYRNLPQLRSLIYSVMDYKSGEDANIKRPTKMLFPSVEKGIETTLPETPQQDVLFKQIKDYIRGKINYSDLCADAIQIFDVNEMTEDDLLVVLFEKGTESQKEKYQQLQQPLDEDDFENLKNIVEKILDKGSGQIADESKIQDEKARDKYRVLAGYGLLKSVTLSPYLSTCQKEQRIEPTYTQYVESSPKLLYSVQCINSIHNYELENNLQKSGCVIYIGEGVNVNFKYKDENGNDVTFKWQENGFEKIKQYLINRYGYSDNEISIINGSVSPEQKEREKNKFLSGKSTVLIGSKSISTGVDLQDNASALFMCTYDWNPTDNEQINGRIHRQGNRFEKIRIVYPMVMNSSDPNTFQQLYEKTLRIKNIWDKNDSGTTLDLKDFDVDSLRKGMMDEPEDKAEYWYKFSTKELEKRQNILNARLSSLRITRQDKDKLDELTPVMKGIIVVLDAYKKTKEKEALQDKFNEKIGDAQLEFDEKKAELDKKLQDDFSFGTKYGEEMVKLSKNLTDLKKKAFEDIYDFETDPDGKFTFLTYDEIGDGDELLKAVNKWITNLDSYFIEKLSKEDKVRIWREWLKPTFPRFDLGYWDMSKAEDEDVKIYIDFDSQDAVRRANEWKGAYRGFGKMKDYLLSVGIVLDEIPQAIEDINNQKQLINEQFSELSSQRQEKLQEFITAKQERLIIQSSIEQRVEEFASYNEILKDVVPTFGFDKGKTVDVTYEVIEIEQKKKEKPVKEPKEKTIKEKIETAVIVDEEVLDDVDTSNLITNLKNGMVARFVLGTNKKGKTKVVDLFFEDDEFIKYDVLEDADGDIVSDSESTMSENEIIDFYTTNYSKLTEEFYDDGAVEDEEEQEEKIDEEVVVTTKTKAEIYKDLIQGYELSLEFETDENKIKVFNEIIDGYKIALDFE